jgi:peptidoglycan hydrolase-like protein with peptidoglycan-binding domain
MAETRELSRVVPAGTGNVPDSDPAISQIQDALQALGNGHRGRALDIIDAMAR